MEINLLMLVIIFILGFILLILFSAINKWIDESANGTSVKYWKEFAEGLNDTELVANYKALQLMDKISDPNLSYQIELQELKKVINERGI